MSSSQTSGTVASGNSLSFVQISKLFSLPIAEAANILGVCSSVLKRICRENGVVRWPYRKFLAGKSVEEIQKDAARERRKEMSRAARNASGSPGVSSTSGAQLQAKTLSSGPAHILQQQQQGNNRLFQNGWPNNMVHQSSSSLPKNIPAYVDEFKQGFPSNGLSTVNIRWWGSRRPDGSADDFDEVVSEQEQDEEPSTTTTTTTTDQVEKQSSLGEPAVADGEAAVEIIMEEKPSLDDRGEATEAEKSKSRSSDNIGPQGTALLLSVRKRAAEKGREALKLGVSRHSTLDLFKVGRRERLLLQKVFKSSLPQSRS